MFFEVLNRKPCRQGKKWKAVLPCTSLSDSEWSKTWWLLSALNQTGDHRLCCHRSNWSQRRVVLTSPCNVLNCSEHIESLVHHFVYCWDRFDYWTENVRVMHCHWVGILNPRVTLQFESACWIARYSSFWTSGVPYISYKMDFEFFRI